MTDQILRKIAKELHSLKIFYTIFKYGIDSLIFEIAGFYSDFFWMMGLGVLNCLFVFKSTSISTVIC